MSARDAFLSLKKQVDAKVAALGRDPATVRILAVSKLQPVEKIAELRQESQADFGENYVQELLLKQEALKDASIRWHLIGHLQKNKVKQITGRCHLIHSVDSFELAELLSRKAADAGVTEKILLQVNVGGELSKEGFSVDEFGRVLPQLATLSSLELHGLMTMPPLPKAGSASPGDEVSANRVHFRRLRELLDATRFQVGTHPWKELSMGTSHDWETALEEGATILRLGTVLFGARPAKKV